MPSFWVRRTVALALSPVGLLLISASRLIIISDYNTTTATTIASSGGYLNTVLGTAIPLVPLFLPYLALLLLLLRRFVLAALTFGAAILVSPTKLAPLMAMTALKGDWHGFVLWIGHNFFLAILFIIAIVAAEAYWLRFFYGEYGESTVTITVAAALATVLLFPYISYVYPVPHLASYYEETMRQPWLPAEKFTLRSGPPFVGYALTSDQDWMVALVARTRTIWYVPANNVIGRRVCETSPSPHNKTTPLFPLLGTRAEKLPQCWGSGASSGQLRSQLNSQEASWTHHALTTASTKFRPVPGLYKLSICALNQVTASLSVELAGAPAGFQIRVDDSPVMEPGPARFVPTGPRDSFAFTYLRNLDPLDGNDHHTFQVQWRSPTGRTARLRKATLDLQYQHGTHGC
jgi:hypothetical protein